MRCRNGACAATRLLLLSNRGHFAAISVLDPSGRLSGEAVCRTGRVAGADSIRIVSGHGKIVTEARVVSAPEAAVRWTKNLDATIAVVCLEAGPLSQ